MIDLTAHDRANRRLGLSMTPPPQIPARSLRWLPVVLAAVVVLVIGVVVQMGGVR